MTQQDNKKTSLEDKAGFYRMSDTERALQARPSVTQEDKQRVVLVERILGIVQQKTVAFATGILVLGRSRIQNRFFVAVHHLGHEEFFFFDSDGRLKWKKGGPDNSSPLSLAEIDNILQQYVSTLTAQ
jgi:hypothetical protein